MGEGDFAEGQRTHQETDIISYSALVAVGDTNVTNELWDKILNQSACHVKKKGTYLRGEGRDGIGGQRFGKLKKHYYGELGPR